MQPVSSAVRRLVQAMPKAELHLHLDGCLRPQTAIELAAHASRVTLIVEGDLVIRLPPVAAGVVVLFAAMPAGANAYIFAMRYQRVVNSASGAVALGTLLSAASAVALISALI